MKAMTALPLTVAALVVAGCSASGSVHVGNVNPATSTTTSSATSTEHTISSTKLAEFMQSFTAKRGLAAQSISCPPTITEQAGATLTCVATYNRGETGAFTVTQKDNVGDVHVEPAEMIAAEVENDIVTHGKQGRGLTVSCPAHVPIVVGNTFHCSAKSASQAHDFVVRIIDVHAGYSWREIS
jgi:hypothetical protein